MEARSARPTVHGRAGGRLAALLTAVLLLTAVQPASAAHTARGATDRTGSTWAGTWATAPTGVPEKDATVFEDQTLRQVVRTSIAGNRVRVRLSNEFGDRPLVIGEARVARRAADGPDSRIDPASDRRLTFGGRSSVTVPAGAPAVSDPVALHAPAGSDLVVSIHLPRRTPGSTTHAFAYRHNYVARGNVTGRTDIDVTRTTDRWYFLSGVSVDTGRSGRASAVVALGNSITDGAGTTFGADRRWPDLLARRLREAPGPDRTGVLNTGISGNRLLHDPNPPEGSEAEGYAAYFGQSALRRFDRDVVERPGARHVIVLLGVNDLGHPGTVAPESERVSAQDVIDGHRRLIARAHEHGLRIYGGTILPFEGDTLGFHSPENEAARREINEWIRNGGEYDGVVDFDAALRDPGRPSRLHPRYDSGDHLHTNDAGAEAMARAVPLHLLR